MITKSELFFNIIKIIYLIILGFIILAIFKEFYLSITNLSKIVIIVGYIIYCFGIIYQKINYQFFGYIIILLSVLFIRDKKTDKINDINYLKDWLKIIFQNKIVFINISGNIILYIPFIIYLYKFKVKYAIIITVVSIVLGEVVQFVMGIGVFDLIDIALNTIGVLIASLIYGVIIWMKKK